MGVLSRAIGGLRGLLRRRAIDQELDAELRDFLERAIERNEQTGMSREAAARAARRELGSAAAVKDRVRDVGWESVVESVWQDVRYAIRGLRKSAGFTAAATLTLALGIGATSAIFSLVDAVMLRSLPVANPDQLVLVGGAQYPVFRAFREYTDIFVDVCATSGVTPLDLEMVDGVRERAAVSLVSGSYFSTFGVGSAVGRVFGVDDDRGAGEAAVAVASYTYWQRRLGGDANVPGRIVRISGRPVTIVGVAAAGFFGEQVGAAPDLWVPLTQWGQIVPGRNNLENPGTGWLKIIGRIRPGVAATGVHPKLTATFRRILTDVHGPKVPDDVQRDIARATVSLEPAGRGLSTLRPQFGRPLLLLMGSVVLVLLIACGNIANLLLARAAARRREIDLRLALGVSGGRLIRQLLTESAVLATVGGALGLAVAWLGREALLRLISPDGSRLPVAVATDARLLSFVAVISCATAILFGLAPAWQSARRSGVSLATRREGIGGRQRLTSALVVAQVAVSLVLLTGAGLFLRTITNLRDVDLGFAPQRLLIVDINPQAAGYRGAAAVALVRRLLERVEAAPGVVSATVSENGLLMGRDLSTNILRPEGALPGREGYPRTFWDVVGPDYFSTIGTPLVSGREFSRQDSTGSPSVVAIDEEMARQLFPGTNPIGRRLVWGTGNAATLEIVAVARDVKHNGPRDERQLRVYFPYLQLPIIRPNWIPASTRFLVRTIGDPGALAPVLRQVIVAEDPRLSIASLDVGPELVTRTLVRERMVATLLVAFGALAVGLACLGLYGLIAFHVAQRTSEVGIRMALGARRVDVLLMTLQRAFVWIGAGVALGVPLAMSASRLAQGLLFGLGTIDLASLTGAVAVMFATGLLAAYWPARRASRIDPLIALRSE
jgi:predicted permease